uniref:Uncharacterized protein n=2 Tax=Aegilops tauschii subsp. strangulata TaxID=200361 RepID=A0A453AIA5_AEGTS
AGSRPAMDSRPPTSGPSVDPVDPIPIPLDTLIHFWIPMGRGPDVLLSVDGSGKTLRSWPDGPCERRATMPDVATSFGEGPLVLVEVDVDGSYFTRTHLPCCAFRSCPSLQGIINRVCSTLGRPLPFCYRPPYPCGDDFVASLVNPPRLGVIANCLSSPCMFTLHLHNWGIVFYIRLDLAGLYHTYPHVAGGPFQTLEEAYSAIHADLQDRRDPRMILHMYSKMLCSIHQFVRPIAKKLPIISISLQGLKELKILTVPWMTCSLLKSRL